MNEKDELDALLKHFKKNGVTVKDLSERIDESVHILYDVARPDGMKKAGDTTFKRVLNKLRKLNKEPLSVDEKLNIIREEINVKFEEIKSILLRIAEK